MPVWKCLVMASQTSHIEVDGGDSYPTSQVYKGIARPLPSDRDEEYKKFVYLMPVSLQEENLDAIIICSPKDSQAAKGFENHLANDISFKCADQYVRPRVRLLEYIGDVKSDYLEMLLAKTTYTFLFLTKSFCEEQSMVSHACLVDTLHDPQRKWSVIPVHTMQKASRNYKLPVILNAIKGVEYLRVDQFYKDGIIGMFYRKADERLRRDNKLNKERKDYFEKNKSCLIKRATQQEAQRGISHHIPEIEIDGEMGCQGLQQNIRADSSARIFSDNQHESLTSSFNQSLRNQDSFPSLSSSSSSNSRQNIGRSLGQTNDSFSSEYSNYSPSPGSRNGSSMPSDISDKEQENMTSQQDGIHYHHHHHHHYHHHHQHTTTKIIVNSADKVAIGEKASINVIAEKIEGSKNCERNSDVSDGDDTTDGVVINRSSPTVAESRGQTEAPSEPNRLGTMMEGFPDLMVQPFSTINTMSE